MEAVQFRKECDEYLEGECRKIQDVLDKYAEDPKLSKKELGVGVRSEKEGNESLTRKEIKLLKVMLNDACKLIS